MFLDFEDSIPHEIDLQSVVDVLIQYLMHNSIQTKVAVLKWIHDLYTKLPSKVRLWFSYILIVLRNNFLFCRWLTI